MTSAQSGSPVARSSRQASITLAIAAQVSAYARSGGSSNGIAERLVAVAAPEAAGEVAPRRDHVAPAAQDGVEQRLVAESRPRRSTAPAVEVELADGVTRDASGASRTGAWSCQ